MAVTLAEIAALAGVSRGTVDRALNDRGRVDPKVAARVRRIAAERGYRPNRAGRMLARAKNPIRIGVIVQSVETMFMHTVFEEIERASAHFTTTGAEVLVRPLEGIDAQQQLDVIDELLDRAWSLPLSGGRCVVDADKVRDLIDDIRLNIPGEIKQAKAIVSDRAEIIDGAKKEAEQIVRKAEDRARALIAQQEVTKAAQAKASEILSQAQIKAREIRQAAQEFSDNCMLKTEEVLVKSLTEIKATRQAFRNATSR